jgi:TATA-box binding protein (TBP) (component of TFIID and TFIIIB)
MKYIPDNLIRYNKLPNVNIATISTTCEINANIDIKAIWEHFIPDYNINTIKFNKKIKSVNSVVINKNTKKLKKLQDKMKITNSNKPSKTKINNFYNCIIIVVNISKHLRKFKNKNVVFYKFKNDEWKYILNNIGAHIHTELSEETDFIFTKNTTNLVNILKEQNISKKINIICSDNFKEIKLYKKKINVFDISNDKNNIGKMNLFKIVNIKLFKNGSIQMTGSKSMEQANIALDITLKYLKKKFIDDDDNKIRILKDKKTNGKIKYNLLKFSDFKIDMINTNFSLDYKIHLEQFYKKLKSYEEKQKEKCKNLKREYKDKLITYEPDIHAGVNIKLEREGNNKNKKVTILVFQSNDPKKLCNLIITGAINENHILQAYNYVMDQINRFKSSIIKIDTEALLQEELLYLRSLKSD